MTLRLIHSKAGWRWRRVPRNYLTCCARVFVPGRGWGWRFEHAQQGSSS